MIYKLRRKSATSTWMKRTFRRRDCKGFFVARGDASLIWGPVGWLDRLDVVQRLPNGEYWHPPFWLYSRTGERKIALPTRYVSDVFFNRRASPEEWEEITLDVPADLDY